MRTLKDQIPIFARSRFNALAKSGTGAWVVGAVAAFHVAPEGERPNRLISPFLLWEGHRGQGNTADDLGVDALLEEAGRQGNPLLFCAMPLTLGDLLGRALEERGWRLEPEEDELLPSRTWAASSGSFPSAARPPLPAGYRLGPLEASDAVVVDGHWHFRGKGTLEMIRSCIKQRPSAAVRGRGGELVSFGVIRVDGSIACLGTFEPHRGRGLARAVVHRLLAEEPGAYAIVEERNASSRALCRKIGLKPTGPEIVYMRAQRLHR